MNVAELKLKIFREVDLLETSKLEEFYGMMLNFINSKKEVDEWVGLTENEIIGIKAAINELDSGKGIPHDKVLSKFKNKYAHV
jgi:hypothetical protein